jgi:hypothetical protein
VTDEEPPELLPLPLPPLSVPDLNPLEPKYVAVAEEDAVLTSGVDDEEEDTVL